MYKDRKVNKYLSNNFNRSYVNYVLAGYFNRNVKNKKIFYLNLIKYTIVLSVFKYSRGKTFDIFKVGCKIDPSRKDVFIRCYCTFQL